MAIVGSIAENIPDAARLVDSCVNHAQRANKLVVYNTPESCSVYGALRQHHDMVEAKKVMNITGGIKPIVRCHRIGMYKCGVSRPLLISLGSRIDSDDILEMRINLKDRHSRVYASLRTDLYQR